VVVRYVLDCCVFGYGQLADSCKHDNEPLGSIKCRKLLGCVIELFVCCVSGAHLSTRLISLCLCVRIGDQPRNWNVLCCDVSTVQPLVSGYFIGARAQATLIIGSSVESRPRLVELSADTHSITTDHS
jgi:hypothetical protein